MSAIAIVVGKRLRKLSGLKIYSSPVLDGVHHGVLKDVAVEIAEAYW